MLYPPTNYLPGLPSIYNGRATKGLDAMEVDAYSAWLACEHKLQPPSIIGGPLTSALGARVLDLHIPPATSAIEVSVLATGDGTVTLETTQDAYYVQIPIGNYSDTQAYADAQEYSTGQTQANVVADGLLRNLNVDPSHHWQTDTLTITVSDLFIGSAPEALTIWAVRVRYLPMPEGTLLPSA